MQTDTATSVETTPPIDGGTPKSDIDPYCDEVLIEPWETYRDLQALGAAVWLNKYQMFALQRDFRLDIPARYRTC
jgi:hypothetical protein